MNPNALAMERDLLAALANSPIGPMIQRHLDSAPTFDFEAMSTEAGECVGVLLTMQQPADQDHMLDNLFIMLGKEPQYDAASIALIRCMCRGIRQHLSDDAVAREFARRAARHALKIYRLAQIATFGPNAGKTAQRN